MRMASALKTIVSKKKRRYVDDGFNLDLSYINRRIIAMGFPAENVESLYRNSLDEVKRFLEQKHKDHYFIYNLCSERIYDPKKFHGRVASYPFDDHHPPDFSTIRPFCEDVQSWLDKDKKNVAVVHCKAGKGRTGVMICCYLLHARVESSAEQVLRFYGEQRTMDQKGVTIPSQRRYINYYANVVRNSLDYRPVKLYLRSVVLRPVPNFPMAGNEFYLKFDVKQQSCGSNAFESPYYLLRRGEPQVQLLLDPPLLICGDVKIEFSSKLKLDMVGIKPRFMQFNKEFHFWFNTYFVDSAFSSGLCHSVEAGQRTRVKASPSVGSSHPDDHLEEEDDEEIVGRLAKCNGHKVSSNGSGVRGLRSYPPPSRHVSSETSEESSCSSNSGGNLCNLMKTTSISDDHLLQERSSAAAGAVATTTSNACRHHVSFNNHHTIHATSSASSCSTSSSSSASAATTQSFSDNRTRHRSVPQTSMARGISAHLPQSQGVLYHLRPPPVGLDVPAGQPVSLHLAKPQIDKVFKDKQSKVYPEDFAVTLFLLRPDDQSDAAALSSSPSCPAPSSSFGKNSSPDTSSDEDTTDSEAVALSANNSSSTNVFRSDWIWRQRRRFRKKSTASLHGLMRQQGGEEEETLWLYSSSAGDISLVQEEQQRSRGHAPSRRRRQSEQW